MLVFFISLPVMAWPIVSIGDFTSKCNSKSMHPLDISANKPKCNSEPLHYSLNVATNESDQKIKAQESDFDYSTDTEREREQIKQISEDEILLSYFTDNSTQSVQIYASVTYDKKNFKKHFAGYSDCRYVTKGLGVLFNSTHKLACKGIKDVSSSIESINTYKGLSCHCSYKTSSGEVFYMQKYPPPTEECLRFASTVV